MVALYMHDSFDPGLADTAATFLLGADRTPDDRRRGASRTTRDALLDPATTHRDQPTTPTTNAN